MKERVPVCHGSFSILPKAPFHTTPRERRRAARRPSTVRSPMSRTIQPSGTPRAPTSASATGAASGAAAGGPASPTSPPSPVAPPSPPVSAGSTSASPTPGATGDWPTDKLRRPSSGSIAKKHSSPPENPSESGDEATFCRAPRKEKVRVRFSNGAMTGSGGGALSALPFFLASLGSGGGGKSCGGGGNSSQTTSIGNLTAT
mmetsp:Transcript_106058/g.304969  ORF Transcript_106058/g.304969 Transcript_106058/m.304969 type:complete len:202 (-) Transcript_106058:395-1000(-)